MRRNCNLELGLLPYSSTSLSLGRIGESRQQEQEQMTIFYNGRICVGNITELQARSIIWLASRNVEEGMGRYPMDGTNPISPTLQSHQFYSPTGLSMKKSLQQFLEKRRQRIQATTPY